MAENLDHFRWLATPGGGQAIDYAGRPHSSGGGPEWRAWQALTSEQRRAATEQANLRQRAGEKFAHAARLLFTRTGLEQATDELIARYKAGRFPPQVPVADLCTGIGGDLMALAQRSHAALGYDRDEVSAWVARHNAEQVAPGAAQVTCGEVAAFDPGAVGGWHIDPDRRASGRRTTHVEGFSPGVEEIERLLTACPQGAVKLAPATTPPADWQPRSEWEWISRGRECRQLAAWFGRLGTPGLRRATLVAGGLGDEPQAHTLCAEAAEIDAAQQQGVVTAANPGRYLLEPDPAVLAAHLAPVLATRLHLSTVASGSAYLTGDDLPTNPLLASFEVLDVLPFDRKQLRAYFRQRQVGVLEIKKRGVEIQPEALRRELRLEGEASATLIVTRLGTGRAPRTAAMVVRRV